MSEPGSVSEAVTRSLYSLAFSLSRGEETVMRPTWNGDMRGVASSYVDLMYMTWFWFHTVGSWIWNGTVESLREYVISASVP